MGSFSWLKADYNPKVVNVPYNKRFKFLIPQEFGGGSVVDTYQDYGTLTDANKNETYDMYELLAIWNRDMPYEDGKVGDYIVAEKGVYMQPVGVFTQRNRHVGIEIGCYDRDIVKLKYPLKLVSASYKGTYETCPGISLSDDEQGFYPFDEDALKGNIKKYNLWKGMFSPKPKETEEEKEQRYQKELIKYLERLVELYTDFEKVTYLNITNNTVSEETHSLIAEIKHIKGVIESIKKQKEEGTY